MPTHYFTNRSFAADREHMERQVPTLSQNLLAAIGASKLNDTEAARAHLWRADLQADRDEQHVVDAVLRAVERPRR